jgi:hypothetical protein
MQRDEFHNWLSSPNITLNREDEMSGTCNKYEIQDKCIQIIGRKIRTDETAKQTRIVCGLFVSGWFPVACCCVHGDEPSDVMEGLE